MLISCTTDKDLGYVHVCVTLRCKEGVHVHPLTSILDDLCRCLLASSFDTPTLTCWVTIVLSCSVTLDSVQPLSARDLANIIQLLTHCTDDVSRWQRSM